MDGVGWVAAFISPVVFSAAEYNSGMKKVAPMLKEIDAPHVASA